MLCVVVAVIVCLVDDCGGGGVVIGVVVASTEVPGGGGRPDAVCLPAVFLENMEDAEDSLSMSPLLIVPEACDGCL